MITMATFVHILDLMMVHLTTLFTLVMGVIRMEVGTLILMLKVLGVKVVEEIAGLISCWEELRSAVFIHHISSNYNC